MSRAPIWSPAASSVWGKSSGFDGEDSLPLVQHLIDSADIAESVWRWLPERVRRTIEDDLPADARDGLVLLRWLAGSHDIGKCSPPFAVKVPPLAERMRDHGLVPPADTTDFRMAPHGLVGHAVLARWLRSRYGAGVKEARGYAVVVGGHHGVPPTSTSLQWLAARDYLIGSPAWHRTQDEILDEMAAYVGANELLSTWSAHRLAPTTQSLLTGAVIVSDWLASNTDLFPFDACDGEARARAAWNDLGMQAPWQPKGVPSDVGEQFARRFPGVGSIPRPVQRVAVDAARTAPTTPLIIIESTMGSGKTEAALLAAEVLAERFGCGGLFVGLPTMATADGLFRRVLDWISNLDGNGATSTHLAHGKASLNEDYRGLFGGSGRAQSVYDEALPSGHVEAQVQSWLTGRKKGVLASMVVGTVDQLLFMALQSKHVVLRQLAFAGKVVVVDEVHAADDFMRMYLCRALEWLAAYGVPVVLLSATLPSPQRQELADAYRAGIGLSPAPLPDTQGYPLVTTVTSAGTVATPAEAGLASTEISVRTVDDDLGTLVSLLEDWLVEGGCVAVIRNTVSRAQETAEALRERYGDDVVLHHSRFIATHRSEREKILRDELGPRGTRPHRRLVVGTQVLEQSLDVDFDAMVTDLAPVDLVLQRVGRLHRHPRTRANAMSSPQLVITGISEWSSDRPTFDRGSERIYGRSRLLRAAGALGLAYEVETKVSLPADIRPLVESAYGAEPPVPADWLLSAQDADTERARAVAEARDRAQHFRLGSISDLEGDLVGLLADSSKEADDGRGTARVRDSEDGIEVIVVQRVHGEVRYIADGSEFAGRLLPVDNGAYPDSDVARALAATTVRLPLALTRPAIFDETLDALEDQGHEGWQQSGWLAGHLVLHLDETWRALLAGHELTYSLDNGLQTTREDSHG